VNTTAKPPRANKQPVRDSHHGIARDDDYAWLRAENWQEVMREPETLPADIREYLEAENAYCEAMMADTETLQARLFAEMKGRIKEDDSSVPAPDGPFAYYVGYLTGAEHPRYCRQPRGGGDEQLLIDGNALAEGEAYFNLGGLNHSPDHALVAYGADRKGSEYYTLAVRDIAAGKDRPDTVSDTGGSAVWAQDSNSFYYVRLDDNHRPSRVYHHVLGTAQSEDALIYEEPDPGFFVSVGKTQSGRFIVIDAHDHQTSEVRLIDQDAGDGALTLVAARKTGHEYDVEHQGERLVILTNRDGAEDFKIVEAPVGDPGVGNWRDLVAHEPGRLILHHVAYRNWLARLEREDGLPRIVIRARDGSEHAIAFDEEAYQLSLAAGLEYDTDQTRFSYSSMTTPSQVFDYDMRSRSRTLRKTQEVPSGHDPGDYRTARVFATAEDGEQVPISLLWHKDTARDGTAPLLLYGYGAYGISIPASFSTSILSLVDRGFVYALAHIRGGKDKGYRWYTAGRAANKHNSFSDFIAAAEHLAHERYTAPGNIIAHGGSAGGLLVGAIANMRPDLFKAILAEVPFVDVLATMLDDTLPLTPPEWPEWGNPIADEAAYRTIAAYSPYDNIREQDYPHILVLAGLTDPRVTYWEPAKWVAKLRATKTDDRLIVLKTNMDAGHAGASGRFDRLHEVALTYAFALKMAGRAAA